MNRRPLLLLLLAGAALTSTEARADGWSTFEAAFPMFPCQDGWMACMVGGEHVDPDLAHDSAGRAIPSDSRIGWFDLQATPSFSPFVGLSTYSDEAAVAEAPAPDEPDEEEEGADAVAVAPSPTSMAADQAAADAEEARTANLTAQREQREAEARRKEADAAAAKQKQAEDEARRAAKAAAAKAGAANAAATADEKARLDREAAAAAQKATEMEKQRKAADQEAAAQRADELAAQQKAASEQARQQQAESARLAAEQTAREEKAKLAALQAAEQAAQQAKAAEAARLAAEKEKAAAPGEAGKAPVVAVPTVADGECADTSKLEPISLLGKLTEGTMQCLETRLANAPKMTDKKKISGLLMTDAWAKGDKERWETLIKRHLDEIDQSDPDLCYKYSLHLSRQGPGRASGVIRWANVALENRTVWIGDTYTSRVYSLYKVRAAASQSLWEQAEAEHAATPSDESRDKVDKYRNMTKVNAREWYEYAKVSGKDETTALQVCMSAAGTSDYCEAN